MRSPKLAALELKRFGRGRLPAAALVALLLLPLLYGALYLCLLGPVRPARPHTGRPGQRGPGGEDRQGGAAGRG